MTTLCKKLGLIVSIVMALSAGNGIYAANETRRNVSEDITISVPMIGKIRIGEWGKQKYTNHRLWATVGVGVATGVLAAVVNKNQSNDGLTETFSKSLDLVCFAGATTLLGVGLAGVRGACFSLGSGFLSYKLARLIFG